MLPDKIIQHNGEIFISRTFYDSDWNAFHGSSKIADEILINNTNLNSIGNLIGITIGEHYGDASGNITGALKGNVTGDLTGIVGKNNPSIK